MGRVLCLRSPHTGADFRVCVVPKGCSGIMATRQIAPDLTQTWCCRTHACSHLHDPTLSLTSPVRTMYDCYLAVLGYLKRNRLADQLYMLEGNPKYAWIARRIGS